MKSVKQGVKRKVKVFGRSIPVLAIVAIVASAGLVSAGLLAYYGKITTSVEVEQAVLLDGMDIRDMPITESLEGVGGSVVYGDSHSLVNNSEVGITVDIVSEAVYGPAGDSSGMTPFPVYVLIPDQSDPDMDEDDIHLSVEPMKWEDFESVTFYYRINEGPSTEVPHVNIMLRDADGKGVCLLLAGGRTGSIGEIASVTYSKGDFVLVFGTPEAELTFWSITVESGVPGRTNTTEDLQVVGVCDVMVNGEPVGNQVRLPTQDYGNIPARTVDFVMAYWFEPDVAPGIYVVETTVYYAGIAEGMGVYFP